MEIIFEKGNKTESDNILRIKAEGEKINMMDFAVLVNQMAFNELIIIDETKELSREKHFWFLHLIIKSIEDAKQNINWLTCAGEKIWVLKDYPYFVKEHQIKRFLEERKKNEKKE